MRPKNATDDREKPQQTRRKTGGNTGLRLRLITERGTTTNKSLAEAFCKSNPFAKEETHKKQCDLAALVVN